MPIIKSAKKKLKQDKKRTQQNEAIKRDYKQAIRTAQKASESKQPVTDEMIQDAYKKIDKAAKANIIHAKKAARLKSQVSKLSSDNK